MSRLSDLLREAGTEVAGQADATGQLLLGLAKQPVAGLTGASHGITALLRGKGKDAALADAVAQIERVNAMGGPVTERGAQRLGELGGTMEKIEEGVGGALGHPIDKLGETQPALAAATLGLMDVAGPGKGAAGTAKRAATTAISKAKAANPFKDIAAGRTVAEAKHAADLGFDPIKLRDEYPTVVEPQLTVDPKTGKEFYPRTMTPEMEALQKFRKAAQKDIEAGNYEPYFKVEDRYYADPANHPLTGATITDALAKKPETIAKHTATFDTPSIRANLLRGYKAAEKDPLAKDWYAMGQLEDSAIKHHGGDVPKGAEAFRNQFAEPMAAWTGGSDPNANFLNASYGNWLEGKNLPTPESAYTPHPVSGRYLANNLKSFDKFRQGNPMSASDQPKRHNFAADFKGHRDLPTIDEQMMGAFDPTGKLQAPPTGTYGVMERVVNDEAAKQGVHPINFQDVAWAGLKGTQGKPMIKQVNESIERTRRVTGQTPEEVVKGYWNRKPMYGVGAGAIGAGTLAELLRDEEVAKGI